MSHYGTLEEFVEYIESRGGTMPTDDDESIEAAMLVGSEWLDSVYGSSFTGHKTGGFAQDREWPRTSAVTNYFPQYVFGTSEIPERVKRASYEAAFRQLNSPGSLIVDYTPNKYKSVSIDGALSVDYAMINQSSDIQVQIGIIDQLLAPLLNLNSSGSLSSLSGGTNRV